MRHINGETAAERSNKAHSVPGYGIPKTRGDVISPAK